MKRNLIITAAILAAVAITACDKENGNDDPIKDYPYSYYEPCMVWGSTKDEITKYMSENLSTWFLEQSASSDNEMTFLDGKYKTISMSYSFKDGKMESATLAYPLRSDSFDRFKSDIEDKCRMEFEYQAQYGLWFGHSALKNMNVNLYNLDSEDTMHTIMAIFTGTGAAPSDKIRFEVTPSNKAPLNYTDFTTIRISFPEAKQVSWYQSFGLKYFSLIDAEGNVIWKELADWSRVSLQDNAITIQLSYSSYDKLTEEGDYTLVFDPETILVDGRLLLEQRITYHLTANHPVITAFELEFDDKVTNNDELHFHIEDGIEVNGWSFIGGTPIYDEENNYVGKVYNFSQVGPNHFLFILKMDTDDTTKQYHFDVEEGLLTAETKGLTIPSAATTVRFKL